jgi:uracil-DNA glycosylase
VLIPVGRLAIDRFLGPSPLDQLVGTTHRVTHEGGESLAIPLPHPSGASSWIHEAGHRALLDRALSLLKVALVDAGAIDATEGTGETAEPAATEARSTGVRSVA